MNARLLDIFCHDDFDGLSAAGILAVFLNDYYDGEAECRFHTVDYQNIADFFARDFHHETAVVDFPFHEKAKWWFDHHSTSFHSDFLKDQYRETPFMFWDDQALSCPELLFVFFKRHYPEFYRRHYDRYRFLIKMANIIDSAGYRSPAEVYDISNNYIALNRMLENLEDRDIRCRFIESVVGDNLKDLFASSYFTEKKRLLNIDLAKKKRFLLNHSSIFNQIILVDYASSDISPERYLHYLFFPDLEYSLIKSVKRGRFHLGVGRNPWKADSEINIGEMLRPLGGGGRRNVGAVILDSREQLDLAGERALKLLSQSVQQTAAPRSHAAIS